MRLTYRKLIFASIGIVTAAVFWVKAGSNRITQEPPLSIEPISDPGAAAVDAPRPHAEASPLEASDSQIRLLNEILASRNDNDLRLDTEFRNLTPETKHALQSRYNELAAEDRNGKGTIVFLLGREIRTTEDLNFFNQVLDEKPCLSLQDCSREAAEARGEEHHLETANQVTLAYPQLVALNALEKFLGAGTNLSAEMKDSASKILAGAKSSGSDVVRKKATVLEQRLKY